MAEAYHPHRCSDCDNLAQVVPAIGDQQINLKKGDTAAALVKSTDVMIERLDEIKTD